MGVEKFREESAAGSNMKFLVIIALIGSAKAIETVGDHQQTPVLYGSEVPTLYGAIDEYGLISESRVDSESRTLPEDSGPQMSALPTSGLKYYNQPSIVPYGQPLVYHPNPYVYIPAIGQVAKPVSEVSESGEVLEVKTIEEKKPVYATNPLVYTHGLQATHPLVYTHGLHP